MKKLIHLCLLLFSILSIESIHAQTLNGVSNYNTGTCFTAVDWEVSYSFEMVPEGVAIQFYNPRITVSSSSEYYTKGQRYSKQSLKLSSWPDENQNPKNMVITFKVSHLDGYANSIVSQPCINGKFAPTIVLRKSNVKSWENISISNFKVISIERMMYANIGSAEVDNLIEAKRNTNSSNMSNSNSNNPASQTNTTNTSNQTQNTTAKPLNNYDPNTGLYTNPMTNTGSGSSTLDSYNKGAQQGQQIADVATGLADLFSPSPEKLQRQANEEAKKEKEKSDTNNYFISESKKYLRDAINGNEHARMVLVGAHSYYKGYGHDFTSMLPDVDKWIQTAAASKNFDAMCFMGRYLLATDAYLQANTPFGLKSKTDFYKILEEAATLGSLDAMEFLAYYYDTKKKYRGGENAEKALYWLNMAAEKGSPSAMFKMGYIFLNNYADAGSKIGSVKYKVDRDDSVAHNWFLKSVSNPNFKESLFQVADKRGASSNTRAYYELGMMYRNGKGCKKDPELSKKLFDEQNKSYRYLTPFSNDMIN